MFKEIEDVQLKLVNIHINSLHQSISSLIDTEQLSLDSTVSDLLYLLQGHSLTKKYVIIKDNKISPFHPPYDNEEECNDKVNNLNRLVRISESPYMYKTIYTC